MRTQRHVSITALVTLLSACSAEPISMVMERDIDASAEEVWDVLGRDFVGVDKWAALVSESTELDAADVPEDFVVDEDAPVAGRVTTTPGGTPKEVLVNYDDDERTFTFKAFDIPPIFTASQNTTKVEAVDDGTARVVMEVNAEAYPAFHDRIREQFPKGFGELLDDLAHYVETGDVSEAKRAQLEGN